MTSASPATGPSEGYPTLTASDLLRVASALRIYATRPLPQGSSRLDRIQTLHGLASAYETLALTTDGLITVSPEAVLAAGDFGLSLPQAQGGVDALAMEYPPSETLVARVRTDQALEDFAACVEEV
jgi:hypothetical protein